MTKKITMQDIADRLNISKNAVSQALTGKPGVSEETRKQIEKIADELGYRYIPRGQNNIKTGNIGLIATDFAFSQTNFFGEIYLSIEQEAQKRNMNLVIQSINQRSIQELSLPAFIEEKSVEGILILSHISTPYINKVLSTGIPTVIIDHHHPNIQADAILTNNRFGSYLAIQHLIELGHKEIAFVGNTRLSPSYQERLEGFRLAFNDYNLKVNEDFLFTNIVEKEENVDQLIKSLAVQPTAWFCINDGFGYFVNSGLKKIGLNVPVDVSVCSFDNGQLARLSTPRITSMDIDLRQYGRKSVEQLCFRIKNHHEPFQEILLPATLVIGESTAVNKRVK